MKIREKRRLTQNKGVSVKIRETWQVWHWIFTRHMRHQEPILKSKTFLSNVQVLHLKFSFLNRFYSEFNPFRDPFLFFPLHLYSQKWLLRPNFLEVFRIPRVRHGCSHSRPPAAAVLALKGGRREVPGWIPGCACGGFFFFFLLRNSRTEDISPIGPKFLVRQSALNPATN